MKRKVWIIILVFAILITAVGCAASSSDSGAPGSSTPPPTPSTEEGDYLSEPGADVPDGDGYAQEGFWQDAQAVKGTLTAGEWNDNRNFDFLTTLIETHPDWGHFSSAWQLTPKRRIEVTVSDKHGVARQNISVKLLDGRGGMLWEARTDNSGRAYLFNRIGLENGDQAAFIRIDDGLRQEEYRLTEEASYSLVFEGDANVEQKLDLMFVVDTTGSMGDELEFLKTEMIDVIDRVREAQGNLEVRLSANVYRDEGDEYVVRAAAFTTAHSSVAAFLQKQYAAGGGDYEEAVEIALADALYEHEWDENATAKLLFLVLDAPPHNTAKNREMMQQLTEDAAREGIRIIPVASSGVDKNTEFLLRTMSTATGGTYLFLTDHSGVGETHLEPTIGQYDVELLNDLMVRVIGEYLS